MLTTGRKYDRISSDIFRAAREGHFEERMDEGPSVLEQTSVFELLETVSIMSPSRRKRYLAQLGRVRHGPTKLSGAQSPKSGGKRTRLSRP